MLPFLNANDEEKNALNRWKWRMFVPLSRHYSQGPRLVEICIGHPGDAYHRSRVIVASRCVQITRANVENRLVRRRVTLRSQLRRKGNKDCDLRAIFSSVLGWWNVQCAHHHRSNANFVLSDFSKLFYSRRTDLTICYSNDNKHHSWNFSVDTWRTSRSVWIRR